MVNDLYIKLGPATINVQRLDVTRHGYYRSKMFENLKFCTLHHIGDNDAVQPTILVAGCQTIINNQIEFGSTKPENTRIFLSIVKFANNMIECVVCIKLCPKDKKLIHHVSAGCCCCRW